MDSQSGERAIAVPEKEQPNPLALDSGGPVAWCSWKPTDSEGKRRLLAAMQSKCDSLSDHLGEKIVVRHVLAHFVTLTNEKTGEVNDATRLVLIDTEGKMYQCVSDGALRSLRSISLPSLYGPPPWTDGLPLIARAIKTQNKRTMLQLEVAE